MISGSTQATPISTARQGRCIGCGICASRAGAVLPMDRFGQYGPDAAQRWAREAGGDFRHICPFSPEAASEDDISARIFPAAGEYSPGAGRFRSAYVGHVREGDYRASGSSGGLLTWIACELLRRNLVDGVAHVVPTGLGRHPYFDYRISRTVERAREGGRSRYYPVQLSRVLAEIREIPGRYAVVGLPCFIKGVNLLRARDPLASERIVVTLGLFCGHMKSAHFAESIASQMNVRAREVAKIDFRVKDPRRPANWYRARVETVSGQGLEKDWWHLTDGDWGAGFFQNSACDLCDDVTAETADISVGDAWVEPYSSDGHGTSVAVIRSPLAEEIIRDGIADGRLALEPVDGAFVDATQAAGLRHRREGLAYRLNWRRFRAAPPKRVQQSTDIAFRRKLVYRMRYGIAVWSHRIFWLTKACGTPKIYDSWSGGALAVYQALAYSRGRLGRTIDRLGMALPRLGRKSAN